MTTTKNSPTLDLNTKSSDMYGRVMLTRDEFAAVKAQSARIAELEGALASIVALPRHPCDDARNLSALEVAQRTARSLLTNKEGR